MRSPNILNCFKLVQRSPIKSERKNKSLLLWYLYFFLVLSRVQDNRVIGATAQTCPYVNLALYICYCTWLLSDYEKNELQKIHHSHQWANIFRLLSSSLLFLACLRWSTFIMPSIICGKISASSNAMGKWSTWDMKNKWHYLLLVQINYIIYQIF